MTPSRYPVVKKTFINSSGNIEVRSSIGDVDACGIVEILHLWNKNKSGCVIAAYTIGSSDGHDTAVLVEIHGRLSSTKFDSDEIIMNAIRYGRKLADLLIESE